MKKLLFLVSSIICILSLCSCDGNYKSHNATWQFFKNTYSEYVSKDKNGIMYWNFETENSVISTEHFNSLEYDGIAATFCNIQHLPLLGNVLFYEVNIDGGSAGVTEFLPTKLSDRAKLYYPVLQVQLNGQWWTLKTNQNNFVNNSMWLQMGSTRFTFSMDSFGTRKCLPEGKYRLVLAFEKGDIFLNNFPKNPQDQSVVLAFEFEHSPDKVQTKETMADIYPGTWKAMRKSYGDYFTLNDEGKFYWNLSRQSSAYPEVNEKWFTPYESDNITIEFCGIEIQGNDSIPQLVFNVGNCTGNSISIDIGAYQLHAYLDDKWWRIYSDYVLNIEGLPHILGESARIYWPTRVYRYCDNVLPECKYRITYRLSEEFDNAVLTDEFYLIHGP